MLIQLTAELLEDAIIYAVGKHRGQRRKGVDFYGNRKPYILHPMSVMMRIFANKVSKNMYMLAIAAICHDIIEDVYETKEEKLVGLLEITEKFGPQVAALVDELTLDKSQYELIGKKEYLAHELNIMSPYALAIKLCDRLENVCDMETVDEKFRDNYIPETWYILSKLNRKLTGSHKNLIQQIKDKLQSYNNTGKYDEYVIINVNENGKTEIYEGNKLIGSQG